MSPIGLRRFWLILLPFFSMFSVSAWAVDPDKRISQYAHASWRLQDGFFNGSPFRIAQAKDGYVWLGTGSGLLRFDGVRFVAWNAQRAERLPSAQIRELLPASDGSLWIVTDRGLSRWKDQRLTNYPGSFGAVLEDRRGNIWIVQVVLSGSGALCRVLETGVRCLGVADGGPELKGPGPMIEDAHGNIWIGDATSLHRWSNGSHTAYRTSGLANNSAEGVMGLASASDDTIWVGIAKPGPGLGLQRLAQGQWKTVQRPGLDGSALTVTALQFDREGSLWVGTSDRGIYRLHENSIDHFDSHDGLSSDFILSFTEDHEGNLWVATSQGVHRFSDTPVISSSAKEGLCSFEVVSVAAGRGRSLWVGGHGGLTHLQDRQVSCVRTGKGLPGTQVTALLEDHSGRLWVGVDSNLWVYERGTFRKITKPDGRGVGFVTGLAEDSEQSIWIVVNRPRRMLMRVRESTAEEVHQELPMPRRVAAAAGGGIWVGTVNGDLAHYRDGTLSTYKAAGADDASLLNQLLSGADGSVLAATSYGLTGWHNGKLLHLDANSGLPCGAVNAFTLDTAGNLWLFMDCALGHISRADLQMWKTNPAMRVSIRTFDASDGVRPGWAPFDAGATSSDGRVWFANSTVLQMIDPARLGRNAVAPPVYIEQVIADRKSYRGTRAVHLPPLTRDLQIDYVGLSFVAPPKVLFRYRLEGRDHAWQEPGSRRQAFYSDLRPGTYRFRVMASNNDGVWNEQGAVLDIVIAAAWYQTNSFLLLCLATSVGAMYALYQLRMHQVARFLNARFDERLAERIRVARELHDTLLQTVQGSKLVADNALRRTEDTGMRRAMEQVSGWLGQASMEARAAVNALRASTRETSDLALALHRAIEDCAPQGSVQTSLSVAGESREMHPAARDEVCRIGHEAIRNACTHSGGSLLEVGLTYGNDLIVRVSDNGVGIDPAVASAGREGHFGLQGMRERAARIGATLTVVSSAGSGTEITVVVPGRVIFTAHAASLFAKMRAHFTS